MRISTYNINSIRGRLPRLLEWLDESRPDVVCLLIGDVADGDRPYAEELKAMIREGGLENHVLLTGRRMDVPDLLAGLDIVMHTSLLGEGFPRVILEAMVLGRPLIVSDSGPNREMIEDGVSGYVVPAEDPAALADPGGDEASAHKAKSYLARADIPAWVLRAE